TPTPATGYGAENVPRAAPRIEIHGLAYSYPGGERRALDGAALTLEAGSLTALVGPSGSGKSTLASLLLRFMEPDAGGISADGKDISGMAADRWRGQVALVGQRPHLFYGTVAENIALARPQASREDVERAAGLAGAGEFIEELPRGYDTPLGERGARLSAGQAQRIAIARAFVQDAPVLVLDEPASSLDPESERALDQALGRLRSGRTVLVIAHRLNTARAADGIVVLEDGRVAQFGTHDELASRAGTYSRLISAHRGSVK
ncbi:MAG: ATP-binding cassette domain-containing protein, partial [Rubrobacter sp.]|nr:ATP-binding cassette domain-containing protein [Rubrobacter sp.]